MLRKLTISLFCVCMLCSLSACDNADMDVDVSNDEEQSQTQNNTTETNDENLVDQDNEVEEDDKTETEDVDVSPSPSTPKPSSSSKPSSTPKPSSAPKPSSTPKPSSSPKPASSSTHNHSYSAATCTQPQKCSCGATIGSALGHNYSGKYCTRCGAKNPNYVEIAVSSIYLDSYSEEIYVGKSIRLTYSISPANATNASLTWKSSNESVATVDSNGNVRGISTGKATITVSSANGKYDTCSIEVKDDLVGKSSLQVPALPKDVNYYTYSGKISSSVKVTGLKYTFEENSYDGTVNLILKLSGTKTYDSNGAGQSSSAKVGIKIYDSAGNVVETDTYYSPSLAMGESFANDEKKIYCIYTFCTAMHIF